MTVSQAQNLATGSMVHHTTKKNADGTPMRARVTSVKTWKRSPERVLVGLKHGLRDYAKFDETEVNLINSGRGS